MAVTEADIPESSTFTKFSANVFLKISQTSLKLYGKNELVQHTENQFFMTKISGSDRGTKTMTGIH